ncbi:MAG: hypothetical protein R3Y11_02520 [Pseudomonadota bacterium]
MIQTAKDTSTFDKYAYRAERMNIYTPNANNLRLGKKAGVFLPEEMLLKD